MSLATVNSWGRSGREDGEVLCFEAVNPNQNQTQGKIVLPSGIEVLVPLSFIESRLNGWLRGGVS